MSTRIIHLESNNLSDLYDETNPIAPSRDVYWAVSVDNIVYIAHVCTDHGRRTDDPKWIWQSATLHQVISLEPLHLEPSIGWQECCGRHGFIHNGQWEPVGDEGWSPA